MNDVSWAAEVHHHRHGAAGESLENHARPVVAKSWEHEHISRPHAAEDFCLADPAAEGNSLLDSKRSGDLLDPSSLRSVTDHGEVSQIVPQKGSGPPQSKITGLPVNQASNKYQLKLSAALGPPRVAGAEGAPDAGLRDKK